MPALRTLELQNVRAMRASVEACLNLGSKRLPALRELLLLGHCDDVRSESDCVRRCLTTWPDLNLVVTHGLWLASVLRTPTCTR